MCDMNPSWAHLRVPCRKELAPHTFMWNHTFCGLFKFCLFICVAWLIQMSDMTWLIYMCDMTHPCAHLRVPLAFLQWRAGTAFIAVSILLFVAHSYALHDSLMSAPQSPKRLRSKEAAQHSSRSASYFFLNAHSYFAHSYFAHSYTWHNSFMSAPQIPNSVCSKELARHSSRWASYFLLQDFAFVLLAPWMLFRLPVTWVIHMCDMTQSCAWHE